MFNKKIFTSVLIGTLAFGLFPTNIFANSNQLAIEKKICENIKIHKEKKLKGENDSHLYELYEISINNNNFYYRIWQDYYINLEKDSYNSSGYTIKYGEKDLKNYEIEDNIIKIDGSTFETRALGINEQLSFIKKLGNDYYYIISKFETAGRVVISSKSEFYKNNEKIFETENNKYISDALVDNSGNIYYVEIFDLNQKDTDPEYRDYNLFEATTYKISNGNKEKLNEYKKLRYYNDASEGHSLDFLYFYELNNDIYFIHSKEIKGEKTFNILKNGKSLCENLENNTNNNGNSGNNNSFLGNSGPSAEAIASMIKKDDRVKTEDSEKNKKEKEVRKKVYNKLKEVSEVNSMRGFDLAFGDLYVNENYYSKDKDGKIIYSDSKAEEKIRILNSIGTFFSENSYEVVKKVHEKFNEEETRSLVSESDFVKDFIYEFEKKFDELETKIDSIAYELPAENVKKIKDRIKNFANKYFKGDYSNTFFTRVYEILQNDRNIKNQAETSNEIFFAINVISNQILSQIGKYEINWVKDKNIEMGITESKRSEIYNSIK